MTPTKGVDLEEIPECRATGGDHNYVEGGERDHGRFHCSRCFVVLSPMAAVEAYREGRAELKALRAEVERLKSLADDGIMWNMRALLTGTPEQLMTAALAAANARAAEAEAGAGALRACLEWYAAFEPGATQEMLGDKAKQELSSRARAALGAKGGER